MESNVFDYLSAMSIAKTMLKKGIISAEDYKKIEARMAKKYGLNSKSLLRQNELI